MIAFHYRDMSFDNILETVKCLAVYGKFIPKAKIESAVFTAKSPKTLYFQRFWGFLPDGFMRPPIRINGNG